MVSPMVTQCHVTFWLPQINIIHYKKASFVSRQGIYHQYQNRYKINPFVKLMLLKIVYKVKMVCPVSQTTQSNLNPYLVTHIT